MAATARSAALPRGTRAQLHDPLADAVEAFDEYGVTLTGFDALQPADLIVLAVPHRDFLVEPDALLALANLGAVFADVKIQPADRRHHCGRSCSMEAMKTRKTRAQRDQPA